MLSRCPLVSPKRRSFFFVRFLVQRAIFSLSFYFFKMYISPLCPILYKKAISFLIVLFSQRLHIFTLFICFSKELYVFPLCSVSSKVIRFFSLFRFVKKLFGSLLVHFIKGLSASSFLAGAETFCCLYPPHFLRPPALFPVPKPSFLLFKLSSAALSRRSRVFLPILDSSVSMRRGARGGILLRRSAPLRIRSRFPR